MSMKALKNRIAVAGVGTTAYGNFPELSDYALAAQAFKEAVADCGIDKNQIDGLVCCRLPYYARMGAILGIDPTWTMQMPPHGRMSGIEGSIGALIRLKHPVEDLLVDAVRRLLHAALLVREHQLAGAQEPPRAQDRQQRVEDGQVADVLRLGGPVERALEDLLKATAIRNPDFYDYDNGLIRAAS